MKIKLFSNCIPVKGAARSIMYDLQRQKYDFIPNSMADVLLQHDGKTLDHIKSAYDNQYDEIINEYVDFLIEKEYAFMTDEPEKFPKISLVWEYPSIISNAIICVSKSNLYDMDAVIEQFDQLNCKAVQIRFYDLYTPTEVAGVLKLFNNSRIKDIELIFQFNKSYKTQDLLKEFQSYHRISKIIIYKSPENKLEFIDELRMFTVTHITNDVSEKSFCGYIHPNNFIQNITFFTESLSFNTCLNRKIVIDKAGNIKNCPSISESFGNINTHQIRTIVETPAFQKKWHIKKDDINVCRDCEFRYMCLDCRAFLNDSEMFNQPAKCAYNPYIAKWKGQDGYVTVDEWNKSNMNN